MIRARCLRRTGHLLPSSSVDVAGTPRSGNKLYSVFARGTFRHELATNPIIRPPNPWRANQLPLQRLSGSLTLRFASTTPVPPPKVEIQPDYVPPPQTATPVPPPKVEIQPDYVPPPQTATPAEAELLPNSLDEVMNSIPTPVYEHLGFLKEMGLDYGWGTTAFVETVLEHVYIYLGTPWWASLGITIFLVRAALFKSAIDAADSNARRQIVKPLEEPINARMRVARAEKNKLAMQEAWRERRVLYRGAGIVWWKSFVPLLQVPFGFGVFRLVRGMTTLPVPGLDTGGVLWFHDLTISDPYFVLPAVASWGYYYAFKKGGENANSELTSERVRLVLLYVLPIGGGLFMLAFPAALQLTLCFTALLSAGQATLFSHGWFRDFAGIQPVPKPDAPKHNSPRYQAPSSSSAKPQTGTGVVGSLKGAVSDIMKAGEEYRMSNSQAQKGRLTDAEKRHAEKYEKRRQQEVAQENAIRKDARFERRQERMTQDRERDERLRRRAEKKAAARSQ